jgi:MFS family permease
VIRAMLPPRGPPRLLAGAQLVSSVGSGMYFVCLALYFTRVLGISAVQLGGGLTAAWAVSFVVGVPVGHLADRWGRRRVAVTMTFGSGVAMTAYLLVHSFWAFLAAACVYTTCQRGSAAAQRALLAALVDERTQVQVRASIQSVYNLGLALGAAAGGGALAIGTADAYRSVMAVNALSFVVAGTLLLRLPADPPSSRPGRLANEPTSVLRDRRYVLISAINTVLVLHVPLIDVALPLWVVRHTDAPRWIIAVLFAVNTLMVVVFQVRISSGVTDLPSAGRYVRRAGLWLAAACVVFAVSAVRTNAYLTAVVLITAAALQAIGEMTQFSGTWQISFALAPPARQGQYQAFFGSSMTIGQMLGPLVLTALLVQGGPAGWIALGVAFALAGLAMSIVGGRQQPLRAENVEGPSERAGIEHSETIMTDEQAT